MSSPKRLTHHLVASVYLEVVVISEQLVLRLASVITERIALTHAAFHVRSICVLNDLTVLRPHPANLHQFAIITTILGDELLDLCKLLLSINSELAALAIERSCTHAP
jgi:hypothetical protein